MTYFTADLSGFEHRYKFKAGIYNILEKKLEKVTVFIDTGCCNTMIPRQLAEQTGRPLGFKKEYRFGGSVIETEAFSIEKIMIGDFALERLIAFAGNYTGGHSEDIILGTNVMNNWEMIVNKREHKFQFRENPPDSLPNKTNIYQNYFDQDGNYICVQYN